MADTLSITDNRTGKTYEVPIAEGAIRATDLKKITTGGDDPGLCTYDPAFMNTAACKSKITYIDGDKGILMYRGYPIEQLAESSTYLETAYLILFGELPTKAQLDTWIYDITMHTMVHENIKKFMEGFTYDAHPMGMFISTVGAMSTFYPDGKQIFDAESRASRPPADREDADARRLRLSPQHRPPYVYPDNDLSFTGNFLNMLFKMTEVKHQRTPSSNARSTCSSSCTLITSRTARPARCARSAVRTSIRTRRWPAPRPRSTARSTAARTKRCCGC